MDNFEKIREDALKVVDMKECPEVTKDFLIRLVADRESMIHITQGISMLELMSSAFVELKGQTDSLCKTAVLMARIRAMFETEEDDN